MQWTEPAGRFLWFENRRGAGSAMIGTTLYEFTTCVRTHAAVARRRTSSVSSISRVSEKTSPNSCGGGDAAEAVPA